MDSSSHHFMAFGFSSFFFIFILVLSILIIVAQWRIYEKAGQPGWAALIPIFNFYILLKIVGKPGWWVVWVIVPLANLVVAIWTTNLLSKSFGKDEAFTIMLIILPWVFYPLLGFGNAEYLGPAGKPKVTEINV